MLSFLIVINLTDHACVVILCYIRNACQWMPVIFNYGAWNGNHGRPCERSVFYDQDGCDEKLILYIFTPNYRPLSSNIHLKKAT